MSIKSNIKTFSNVNLTLTTVYGYMNELLKIFIIMGQGVASGFDMFEYDLESKTPPQNKNTICSRDS